MFTHHVCQFHVQDLLNEIDMFKCSSTFSHMLFSTWCWEGALEWHYAHTSNVQCTLIPMPLDERHMTCFECRNISIPTVKILTTVQLSNSLTAPDMSKHHMTRSVEMYPHELSEHIHVGSQVAERLGNWASNPKVAGFYSRLCQMTLCPWARHFTLLASGRMSLYLLLKD